MANSKERKVVAQPNALVTFAGEQDVEYFAAALDGIAEKASEESGGSREISLRVEDGRIVVGYKRALNV